MLRKTIFLTLAAMLVLLASVFFGNFFISIDALYPWAQVVSYALPIRTPDANLAAAGAWGR